MPCANVGRPSPVVVSLVGSFVVGPPVVASPVSPGIVGSLDPHASAQVLPLADESSLVAPTAPVVTPGSPVVTPLVDAPDPVTPPPLSVKHPASASDSATIPSYTRLTSRPYHADRATIARAFRLCAPHCSQCEHAP